MYTYDPLVDTFYENLSNHGVAITVGNKTIKALFKLVQDGSVKDKNQYLTMFTKYSDDFPQGAEFTLNGEHYLALKDNTNENTVYNKAKCVLCNQFIKYELKHTDDKHQADLVEFYACGDNITATNSSTGGLTTLQSTCHFTFPLNDLTKRIDLNDRFFAGQSKTGVWKVRDINYQNGLCEVYCNRDSTKSVDDPENMIADRWTYERIGDKYSIALSPDSINLIEGNTQTITYTVTKNGVPMEEAPKIEYLIDNHSVVSVDPDTNTLTCLKKGKATIKAKYEPLAGDTSVSNTINVEVAEIPPDNYVVTLQPKTLTLLVNDTENIKATVTKNGVAMQDVPTLTYVVDEPLVAKVDPNTNIVTALSVGKASITATYKPNERDICQADTISIEVKEIPPEPVHTFEVILTPDVVELHPNGSKTLTAQVTKDGVVVEPTPKIQYTIEPSGVATIDDTNTIKATTVGKCTITGSYKETDRDIVKADTVQVDVTEAPEPGDTYTVILNTHNVYLNLKGTNTRKLIHRVQKNGVLMNPTPPITYTVEPSGVARVDSNETIIAIGAGKCTVTGNYNAKPNDVVVTDSTEVEVVDIVPSIRIEPKYEDSPKYRQGDTFYRLRECEKMKIIAYADGVLYPNWIITPYNSDIPSDKYRAYLGEETIDGFKTATVEVEAKAMYNTPLCFEFYEKSTKIRVKYYVKLDPLF